MQLSNALMREVTVPPSPHSSPSHSPALTASPPTRELGTAASMPTQPVAGSRLAPPPDGVSFFAWEMLLVNIVDAQRHSGPSFAPLREAVQMVVRELRAGGQTWDQVYAVLHGVVTPAPAKLVSWTMEYEMHFSRNVALVAYIQSWADVERLAEIEAEAHAD